LATAFGTKITRGNNGAMPDIRKRSGVFEATWEKAVDYLAEHAGRWVPGWELADVVYQGFCSRAAVAQLMRRARRYFPIESGRLGYRIGRPDLSAFDCPKCGRRRVRYSDEWVCYGCPGTAAVDLEVGRTPYAEGSRGGKQWTDAEIDLALSLNETHTFEQIGELVNRSGNAVRGLYDSLGVEKKYAMGKRLGE
jgi:hypothetical protein